MLTAIAELAVRYVPYLWFGHVHSPQQITEYHAFVDSHLPLPPQQDSLSCEPVLPRYTEMTHIWQNQYRRLNQANQQKECHQYIALTKLNHFLLLRLATT